MVITFDNVEFKYVEKKLLDKVSFSITDSDKMGLIGVNGTGKTTLLKLITGLENPNKGTIIKSGGMVINYLSQDPIFDKDSTILDVVMKDSTKEHPIYDYEAKSILSKLELNDYDILVKNLSGGQIKRLALCKVLVTYCDLLILDEPTNHLDNDLIVWLEKYLMKFKKGLLMVTHDRYFLSRICSKMLELDNGNIYLYEANYEKFLELKEQRLKDESNYKKKLKSILKKEQAWMNKSVEARRTKSKSRIARFEEMNSIEFSESKDMEFNSISTRLGKKILEIYNVSKQYGDKVLFKNFDFMLSKEDIVGIVGSNGAGKTTLFKIIQGLEEVTSGEIVKGVTLKVGYFSQHLELMDDDIRVIDYIKEEQNIIKTLDGEINASTLCENFLFDKETQYAKVKMLSGGEKRRLQLVRVLISNPNVLILDEPTNDLDIYTLEILEDYLMNFTGPILVVSHDRYFLDKICNKLLAFEDKLINEYSLSFSDYLQTKTTKAQQNTKTNTKKEVKRLPASIRNEITKIDEQMPLLEQQISDLEIELKKETTNYIKIMELSEKINTLKEQLDTLIERYFELEEIKKEYS